MEQGGLGVPQLGRDALTPGVTAITKLGCHLPTWCLHRAPQPGSAQGIVPLK